MQLPPELPQDSEMVDLLKRGHSAQWEAAIHSAQQETPAAAWEAFARGDITVPMVGTPELPGPSDENIVLGGLWRKQSPHTDPPS